MSKPPEMRNIFYKYWEQRLLKDAEDAMVNITIYDMIGRIVSNLVSSQQRAGFKSIQWNATNNQGQPVSAGLYLYTIEAGQFRQTRKMVLLK